MAQLKLMFLLLLFIYSLPEQWVFMHILCNVLDILGFLSFSICTLLYMVMIYIFRYLSQNIKIHCNLHFLVWERESFFQLVSFLIHCHWQWHIFKCCAHREFSLSIVFTSRWLQQHLVKVWNTSHTYVSCFPFSLIFRDSFYFLFTLVLILYIFYLHLSCK